ncbi:MAG: hypothetical protein EZS26_002493 [Candidatus Ordinivivax streblomastigis]|uniref:Uncharacterized protein n=1 Tax=Candidatus Ordinivivax streblomastigis TaxID=2540710 RepID=A0A5M8NWT3_9BACT|nr:MAG: hypothetical protein EZS26_002493 [Candidatus Ordinivivax streblomastigis]
MDNAIILAIIDKLNHSRPDKDNCIILNSFDIKNIEIVNDFNFFEQYQLYITLKAEGYELLSMEKHTIKVKKTNNVIYFP